MLKVDITYDTETWYYDVLILSKWIATQSKSLDDLVLNLWESMSLLYLKSQK